ncbi:class I SAM-dependent methyltransferase [Mycolicibacterium komossense]|uniref:Methyltransferase domain-containing protein n=1 Tax=Mycolicibacterium komossense TaxID=1779 RepID=A0ABT3CIW3_9MYCO|nr:class I SAM-dependent methyltransferase [Mycolicibacterium komossense]MCV7229391.1 methyltransferase domain-containing protein [Mycolicibacterium komossense]
MDHWDFLSSTRDGYDRTAAAYADRFHHHLDDKPVDLAMLDAFAGLVVRTPNIRVADVGCGTGATTGRFARLGIDAFGIDLSANMIAQARRLNPGLEFQVGSMTDLHIADGSLGGVCAWYSIIHIPDELLPGVLAEFHRVLAPGGVVLLAFQVGSEPLVLTSAFGHDVHVTYRRRQADLVEALLVKAGFRMCAHTVRQSDGDGESTPQAYLIARKA